MVIFLALISNLRSIVRSRAVLEWKKLALPHQIGVLQRSARKRPEWTPCDRLLWVWMSRIWRDWRSGLAIVQPETVIAWHRKQVPNTSLVSEGFAPAATHSASGNGASRGGTTGRWTSPPLRTTSRLSEPPPLLIVLIVPIKHRRSICARPLCSASFVAPAMRERKPTNPTNFVPSSRRSRFFSTIEFLIATDRSCIASERMNRRMSQVPCLSDE
jgi:hypothetical protein